MTGRLVLQKGWRESDFSWRGSMWTVPPVPGVYGRDLTAAEKRKLGLGKKRLAFRQGNYVPNNSRRAGIRGGDIILGIDRKPLRMTMLQFNAWVRQNYKVGDRIRFNVIRNGKRIDVPLTLPAKGG